MIHNPVFIIGTERSGSNLLRLMLNAHPHIAIPHPPHVMRDMSPLARYYGDLSSDFALQRLARDMAWLVNHHFAPWPFAVKAEELAANAPSRSLYGVYVSLYEIYLRHEGKRRWGCKSTFMAEHMDDIRDHHSCARFLHLVRDPRDVAASAGESIFSRYHPHRQARLWNEQQARVENSLGADVLQVRYEDLVGCPEKELSKIMAFLEEEYFPGQLQYFRGGEAGRLSSLSQSWKNCGAPVSSKSVGRFRTRLSSAEIADVESAARELMKKYGYEPEGRPDGTQPGVFRLARIWTGEIGKMLKAEAGSFMKDKNFLLRWKKRFMIQYLKLIRSLSYGWSFRRY